jgi:hypothetical protein
MKAVKALTLCCIGAVVSFSCKKDKSINWFGELQGTVWAGEFKYNAGAYPYPQPVSIVFNNDSTFEWYARLGNRLGKWGVSDRQLRLDMNVGGNITADITGDSLARITSLSTPGYELLGLSRTLPVTTENLQGTIWTGTIAGNSFSLTILPGGQLIYKILGFASAAIPYTIAGAGIKFHDGTISMYGVFKQPNRLTGVYYDGTNYASWIATKQ